MEINDIKIEYDGKYPNLCSGNLIITINGTKWKFPEDCLLSGGSVSFDDDFNEHVSIGPWTVSIWPKDFPDNLKKMTLNSINENIPYGCCGGCI